MRATDRFKGQDWNKIRAKLTVFAHRRTHKRSLALAEDLAQAAITDVIARPESWDPEKEPLLKHLAKRVIGLASNEWSRKKTTLEVLFAPTEEDEEPPDVAQDEDTIEDVLDRRRLAARFRARLEEAVAGDEDALLVVSHMTEGRDTPTAIRDASRVPLPRVCAARRRVMYCAKAIGKEMSDEIDAADDARLDGRTDDDKGSMGEEEVGQ